MRQIHTLLLRPNVKKARNVYHFFISFSLSLLLLLWICRVSILSFESKCHHHGIIVSPYCRGGPLFDPRIPKIVIANPTYYCHQVMLQLMIEIMYNYNLKMVDSPGGKFIAYANDAKNSLYENHYFDDKTVMFWDWILCDCHFLCFVKWEIGKTMLTIQRRHL